MNTNLAHNLFNYFGVALAILGSVLVFTGCSVDAITGAYDCSGSWLSPWWLAIILPVLGAKDAIKVVINLVRDGFSGMFKEQPPVASATQTITTPVNVVADKGQAKGQVEIKVETSTPTPAPSPTSPPGHNYNR